MKNLKITTVIVVYNKKIEETTTWKCIHSFSIRTEFLVIDNSDYDAGNDLFCIDNDIRYISMEGNKGLSKAYNRAVEASISSDYIVFLDDDTNITEEYYKLLFDSIRRYPDVDVFVPIIRGQDGIIYSPNYYRFLKNKLINKTNQEVPQERFNAIASCMAVHMRVFNSYRFKEELFVDQVDQYFFYEQRGRNRKFATLNTEIKQNFYQRDKVLSASIGWNRLRLRIIDIFTQARLMGGGKYVIGAYLKCCGLGVQIGKKCHTVSIAFNAIQLSSKLLFDRYARE